MARLYATLFRSELPGARIANVFRILESIEGTPLDRGQHILCSSQGWIRVPRVSPIRSRKHLGSMIGNLNIIGMQKLFRDSPRASGFWNVKLMAYVETG